jgi:hypothetical protein
MRKKRSNRPDEDEEQTMPEAATWLKNPKPAAAEKPKRRPLPGLPWTAAELAAEPPWQGPDEEE